ncbi:MAG: tetratricopeptide repeat protein [Treponema sp.]|nr:tetratricopeptide repeat protein [Treponema sp.]
MLFAALSAGCATQAASAEEYYSIGMAYFDLGKFDEAEKWLNRAKTANKTMIASEYNLGRIAFETKRYEEAAGIFEAILKKDQDNALALKAAAYSRIKTGEISLAEKHYARLLQLAPESADSGYNHALVLYVMERYGEAEEVLERYPYALPDSAEMTLLYARCLSAQNKAEAVDQYARWLESNSDVKVRYEYAQILERNELYARALEEYRKALKDYGEKTTEPKKADLRFAVARLLLVADSASEEGITEMEAAVKDGFNDIEAAEELHKREAVSADNKAKLAEIISNMKLAAEKNKPKEEPPAGTETVSETETKETPQ